MALIPPQFLDCVVAIGLTDKNRPNLYAWQATGFLVGRFIRETEEDGVPKRHYSIYLVTNKHVFEHFEENGDESFVVGFNPQPAEKGEVRIYPGFLAENGERIWTRHQNEDVAVIPINASRLRQEKRQFEFFRLEDNIVTVAKMNSVGISEGDFVYVLGYPQGLVDQDWHYPIARSGSIARIRDMLDRRRSTFLLDILNFPGGSGSPVVTKPEIVRVGETQAVGEAHVIGILSGFIPYAGVVSNESGKNWDLVQNSGLAVGISSECILETIEDDFKKRSASFDLQPNEIR